MFDIGFTELTLIFIIGLVVLGPERLPTVARTLGHWIGRARSTLNHLKSELERETITQDMQERMEKQMRQMGLDEDSIREAKDSLLSPEQIARSRTPRDKPLSAALNNDESPSDKDSADKNNHDQDSRRHD
ncbi:MAG: preprotein translocase subunit TatB [Alcanivorax borkumensis]|jgi:sec-independent protein translocase protein TatB|uniref:Sec-independent protein translocase protein TatB n=1 Tax=Alcanivorax borkumensis (strain ATCC 700651 / DSM 11573 / NCIMB 13689 / SK2) TaxID=393595 RepID=TATB_ALCBS|nr:MULTISPECIES: Sec-independent protein translocase protein TatB [Alcanivorax]Q0VM99.1 RecName: Full=Sec-independent protein translocase protein TatB [Alcanivorax borkumensis SK2]OJH07182.1 MAG: preprotein translocase subunit TatB [Alcanivorax borkumensis]EUC67944.1 preprotein translocase subunit TatB [Alcanivorax sp. 97CO-5]PKG00372.1 twin-arginine translocase subunit TatB [Alcanivorax sp. 97CO-6]CAL17699.1 Sec-independent protein translocase TatB [Alcanivorax borkumensis SK2]BAP15158.1 Sec